MGRQPRSSEDQELDTTIGRRVAEARRALGWTQTDLGVRLSLSAAQVSALEAGRFGFSAAALQRVSRALGRSVGSLHGEGEAVESLPWLADFTGLQLREQYIVVDLVRKLAHWPAAHVQLQPRKAPSSGPLFIALEGIDGVILRRVGEAMSSRLVRSRLVDHAPHRYDEPPWAHWLLPRLRALVGQPGGAFERTLLFACERLYRQSTAIRPRLDEGISVVAPYFTLAPGVYQLVEGHPDRGIIDLLEVLVFKPNLVVLVRSDATRAAERATCDAPKDGQFFSQYRDLEDFVEALRRYDHAAIEFRARGYSVLEIDDASDEQCDEIAEKVVAACHRLAVEGDPRA